MQLAREAARVALERIDELHRLQAEALRQQHEAGTRAAAADMGFPLPAHFGGDNPEMESIAAEPADHVDALHIDYGHVTDSDGGADKDEDDPWATPFADSDGVPTPPTPSQSEGNPSQSDSSWADAVGGSDLEAELFGPISPSSVTVTLPTNDVTQTQPDDGQPYRESPEEVN